MNPHSIGRLDPDPGGLKRATIKKKKNAAKRQIIRHQTYKSKCNCYKNVYFDFIFIKIEHYFFTLTKFLFSMYIQIRIHFENWIRIHRKSWIRIRIKSMRIRNNVDNLTKFFKGSLTKQARQG
jgi:hypothetical protein